MSVVDEVRRLEEENIELKAESEHRKNMLIDQHTKFKVIVARKNSFLESAAAEMKKLEDELLKRNEEIKQLSARLERFGLVRDLLNDAQYGVSPIEQNRRTDDFFQNLPVKVN